MDVRIIGRAPCKTCLAMIPRTEYGAKYTTSIVAGLETDRIFQNLMVTRNRDRADGYIAARLESNRLVIIFNKYIPTFANLYNARKCCHRLHFLPEKNTLLQTRASVNLRTRNSSEANERRNSHLARSIEASNIQRVGRKFPDIWCALGVIFRGHRLVHRVSLNKDWTWDPVEWFQRTGTVQTRSWEVIGHTTYVAPSDYSLPTTQSAARHIGTPREANLSSPAPT